MNPSGMKQQFMQAMMMLFVISFVVHLIGLWLAPFLPLVVVAGLLAVVVRLVLARRR